MRFHRKATKVEAMSPLETDPFFQRQQELASESRCITVRAPDMILPCQLDSLDRLAAFFFPSRFFCLPQSTYAPR